MEVSRRKSKEAGGSIENTYKLQAAESKLAELTSAMMTVGKEAAAAMVAVEAQQQRLTLQRLIAMVGFRIQKFVRNINLELQRILSGAIVLASCDRPLKPLKFRIQTFVFVCFHLRRYIVHLYILGLYVRLSI